MVTNKLLTINIGKNGLSSNVFNEIKDILIKYKKVKIKFLQNSAERDNFQNAIDTLLQKTNTKLIKKRGFVLIIAKK